MNNPQYRAPGREHIPLLPKGFFAIRIVQLVLALIIMGLAGYGVSVLPFSGNCYILAVAVMTLATSIYQLVAELGPPAAYNYWATLGLDIFYVVMWLCSFAVLAASVAPWFGYSSYSYSYSYSRYSSSSLSDYTLIWLATQAAAASLGALEFILYLTSLIIHSVRLHRHRAAGLHCMPGTPPGPRPPAGTTVVPVPVVYTTGNKPGGPLPVYPQFPPQQPVPAYLHGQQPQQVPPQQQQQFYPPQGYAPVPIPMQGMPMQQMPMPPQQQPQQGFYAPPVQMQQQQQPQQMQPPQPTGSPAPQPIVPQATGGSFAASSQGGQQVPQQQQVSQLPAN
ncbi:integral membrane protein [Parachaetomium inaequale]|uniref:Integral membrane protein n=1 Tax=Parachaetomium inaequale TaxID=2588326 RepID=A0AAN6PTV8_9PEZI|nr:integral membrane protein [Parachaetomium inaequale]